MSDNNAFASRSLIPMTIVYIKCRPEDTNALYRDELANSSVGPSVLLTDLRPHRFRISFVNIYISFSSCAIDEKTGR